MQSITRLSLFMILAALPALGCDVSTQGNQGRIAFTPDECGRFAGCDFTNPIGVDGRLLVHISGIEGQSTIGLDLEASDPELLAVSPTGDVGGQPTWQLIGLAEGSVSILAVDDNREVVDFIDVRVTLPDKLIMENIVGEAVGPSADAPGYDEHWIVNANQRVLFWALATEQDASPIMGQYEYTVTMSPELDADVNDQEILSLGRLDVTPTTPGQYEVLLGNNAGNSILVLLDVQDTQ